MTEKLLPCRDWDEDTAHENGNYQNHCTYCEHLFIGHKRRHVCKRCDWLSRPAQTPYPEALEKVARAIRSTKISPAPINIILNGKEDDYLKYELENYWQHDIPAAKAALAALGISEGKDGTV